MAAFFILSFYGVVAGWSIRYVLLTANNMFEFQIKNPLLALYTHHIAKINLQRLLLWTLVCTSIAIVVRIVVGPLIIDDAYIFFRYARNLLQGHGPVFNPGERVLGISSPSYLLVLTIIGLTTVIPTPVFFSSCFRLSENPSIANFDAQ